MKVELEMPYHKAEFMSKLLSDLPFVTVHSGLAPKGGALATNETKGEEAAATKKTT